MIIEFKSSIQSSTKFNSIIVKERKRKRKKRRDREKKKENRK